MQESKLQALWYLMRADKPIGTYLLLWPTLWGLLLAAGGMPDPKILFIFIAGVVVMRAAGCVINDFADRHLDGAVERTSQRPLVTGKVSEKEALLLFFSLLLGAFVLVTQLNTLTIYMSLVAVFLATCYPFMKRFTYLPQFVLGMAFSWSIIMAFTAVQGRIPDYAWLIYLANLLWTVAYDTMYAMVDRDDDIKIGIKSTAILFGKYDRLIIALLQVLMLSLLGLAYWYLELSYVAFLGLLLAAVLFSRQQWQIRQRERQPCFQAFLDNNNVGFLITLTLVLHYLL